MFTSLMKSPRVRVVAAKAAKRLRAVPHILGTGADPKLKRRPKGFWARDSETTQIEIQWISPDNDASIAGPGVRVRLSSAIGVL